MYSVETKTVRIPATVEVRKSRGNAMVHWGGAQGHGKNEAEALADIAKSTGEFLAESLFPKYRWANGSLFILYRHPCGWAYDIVRPGSDNHSTCLMDSKSEREAMETMLRHVSQELADASAAD